MLKLFTMVTGDNYDILSAETPESRKKVIALGSLVFIPVIIWFVIGYNLGDKFLQLSVLGNVILAAVLSFIIFILERTIIMSPKSGWINFFRIFLGLVVALLGAIFIDEIIFKEDIDYQVEQMKLDDINKAQDAIKADFTQSLNASESKMNKLYEEWQKAQILANQEADGTGGSGVGGFGRVTQLKQDAAADLKDQYTEAKFRHKMIEEEQSALIEESVKTINNTSYSGLLIRVKALISLVKSDVVVAAVYSIIFIFLLLLEFMVIIFKFNWSSTNYEKRMKMIEEVGQHKMDQLRSRYEYLHQLEKNPEVSDTRRYLNQHKVKSMFN